MDKDGNVKTWASGDITNDAEGDIKNTATNITNEASEKMTNKATDIVNEASNSITSNVGNTSIQQRVNDIVMGYGDKSTIQINEESVDTTSKVINNKASEVINNEAININNTASGVITSTANEIKNKADKLISNQVGNNTYVNIEDEKITESIHTDKHGNTSQSTLTQTKRDIIDGAKASSTQQTADSIDDAVTDGTNTSVQNQKADQITSQIQDKSGNVNNSVSTATGNTSAVKDGAGNANVVATNATSTTNAITDGTNTNSVVSTANGTVFHNTGANTPITENEKTGTATTTTIKGNTISTGKATMDFAEVLKDLGVRGDAVIDGKTTTGSLEVKGESQLNGNTTIGTAEKNADLKVNGNSTVTGNQTIGGTLDVAKKATFQDSVDIAKDLNVGGTATASAFKVSGTGISLDNQGLNMDNHKITNVADGEIASGSKDAVNGGQLYKVREDLNDRVDRVGANAAAMANLHPLEYDGSKWSIAGAIGNYGSETAAAIGAFFRPNEDVSFNVSTTLGTGENMVGGGVSVRLGKGGTKRVTREENEALKAQVQSLTARMDALLSVLNPNMSQDFPDVPENHWAYEAVSRLAGNGIVEGYPDGEFHGERTMTRYEMAEIIYNALSQGAQAEKDLVDEFKPELQAMAASQKAAASDAAPAAPVAEAPAAE